MKAHLYGGPEHNKQLVVCDSLHCGELVLAELPRVELRALTKAEMAQPVRYVRHIYRHIGWTHSHHALFMYERTER